MKGLKFGSVLSYDYTLEYRNAVKDGLISEVVVPYADLLFPMLAAERFDVFIMDKAAGVYIYNTEYREKFDDIITYLDGPLTTLEYSLRFSDDREKSRRLVNIFNTSLKEMREAGTISRYYREFEQGAYFRP
jgi:ABC-type amino acid transport substrate-binding protein